MLTRTVIGLTGSPAWLKNRLHVQKRVLWKAYRHFARQVGNEFARSPASEWLLDNFHIVQVAWRNIHEDMPVQFYRQLPKLSTSALRGKPRIYGVALEAIQACQADLKTDQLKNFISTYQQSTILDIGELWALPVMLRLGVLDYLTRAVGNLLELQEPAEDLAPAALPGLETISDEAMVTLSIQSLGNLETENWKDFFEQVSLVEQVLRQDPSGAYGLMDFDSRDRYRKAVEALAGKITYSEAEVAREAVRLAQQGPIKNLSEADHYRHVGYYLMDAGRSRLEAQLGFKPAALTGLKRWLLNRPTLVYLGTIGILTLLILLLLIGYGYSAGAAALQLCLISFFFLIPVVTAAVTLTNWGLTRLVSCRVLPKLDFKNGIPADCRTIVVIPALLSGTDEIDALLRQLERHYLGNSDPHLFFALLTDVDDAPEKEIPQDRELIARTVTGIERLNKGYGTSRGNEAGHSPFFLFHRERLWNPQEKKWMGWERKRGKLDEFNRLLSGEEKTSYVVRIGDMAALSNIRYVITLDADTLLPRETAHRLIGTLAHPLNRVRFDSQTGEGVTGYTVLQPRTEIHPVSANRSLFSAIFSGSSGLDLYSTAASDVYHDLFGEGIYTGKGIYDIAAFERILARRIPDNALLSHDLLEGLHVRVGLATDIVLLEEYPPSYPVYARRLHRWVRGDWQLLPWLLFRKPHPEAISSPYRIPLIGRWKILDNLIRSLFVPAMLVLFIAVWLLFPGPAIVWTLLALLLSAVPLVLQAITQLPAQFRDQTSLRDTVACFRLPGFRWLLMLAFLPYEALITMDAVFRTLYRLWVSHRRLLEWTTSASTVRAFENKGKSGRFWQRMWGAPLIAAGVFFLLSAFNVMAFFSAAPLLIAWFLSPYIAYRISRPAEIAQEVLETGQRYQLRRLARRTWFFFEQFVGPEDYWLPPDHFQQSPLGLVAHRTSPTNIGLLLLSTLSAYDLGYIGLPLLSVRLRNTIDAMEKLERHRGHFLNWYETRSLQPLQPRYVSTVDSGNLAACLLTLRQGCAGLQNVSILRWQRYQGLLDTLDVLDDIVSHFKKVAYEAVSPVKSQWDQIRNHILAVQDEPKQWISLLHQMEDDVLPELDRRLADMVETKGHLLKAADLNSLRLWTQRIHYQLRNALRELLRLAPWLSMLGSVPALLQTANTPAAEEWNGLKSSLPLMPNIDEVEEICESALTRIDRLQKALNTMPATQEHGEAIAWCGQLKKSLLSAQENAQYILSDLMEIGRQAEAMVADMDFAFLFNPRRQLFYIGYNVDAGALDANHYDLIASEARIASLVAIAKGDVPQSHWLHLSRPMTQVDNTRYLLSWSGSMFEYLMPVLLMRENEFTLLGQSARAAVARQIAFGKQKKVPWGVSESAYYRFNADMHYQYRAFGVPELGFKRGLEEDLVIAPYASLLALTIRPRAVVDNIAALTKQNALGIYGFYEALDYTPSRLSIGETQAVIRSFYSHHQGMILLSLANYLTEGRMIDRFHSDSRIQSADLLLQEKSSNQAPLEKLPEMTAARPRSGKPEIEMNSWPVPVHTPFPHVHLLSNGHYGCFVTSAGSGFSMWEKTALTRWRADTTLDNQGSWIYVCDQESGELWSATYQPVGKAPNKVEIRFSPHKADFQTKFQDIVLHTEITVPPEDAMEIRRLTITNQGHRTRRLFAASYGEVVLAPPEVDRRHPAFNKLFIESRFIEEINGLLFRRRPRSANESPIFLIHGLILPEGTAATGAHETNRLRFLGRGRTTRDPIWPAQGKNGVGGSSGATLDPIMSMGQEIELEPNQKIQIAWFTLAANTQELAMETAERFRNLSAVDRAFSRAETKIRSELRQLALSSPELATIQKLLSVMLYPHPVLRADPKTLAANTRGQPGLWPHAISGDNPILLVRISGQEGTAIVQELLRAHAYWRNRRFTIDLVIVNMKESGYAQELQGELHRLFQRTNSDEWLNRRGGIFLLNADQMEEADLVLLDTAARGILDAEKGTLADQLAGIDAAPTPPLPNFIRGPAPAEKPAPTPPLSRPSDLQFDNGLGGFTPDGREYVIYLAPGQMPPAPWINVIANPAFGFTISESGSGNTWAGNSGENRLTPWHNDPVSDPPGEALYLRDEETAQIWSPTPLPAGEPEPHLIRHGAGYTVFEHRSHGICQQMRLFAPVADPVKLICLRLENMSGRKRRITATYYADWVLGPDREGMQPFIVTSYDNEDHALFVHNTYNTEFSGRVAFLSADRPLHGFTASRSEFLGRMGDYRCPAALGRIGLANDTTAGIDPCGAVQVHLNLAPGEVHKVCFLLGQGKNREEAQGIVAKYRKPGRIDAAWQETTALWEALLGSVTVETPDAAMDLMLNRWLVYQNLSCRIWGRSALYQSSGAFGFRDQLQDMMGVLHHRPEIARKHLLLAARHQFAEGDVLHWWHPPSGRGVRTRMTDDLLWLPYVTAHYVKVTGDVSVLDEQIPFLQAKVLEPEEEERYGHYEHTAESFSLYKHCLRAIEKAATRGKHGLPLIGAGDWNDGMNRVGIAGKGESVWLGWFLGATLIDFADICRKMDHGGQADTFIAMARELRRDIEASGWDGEWYLRGYYDDGVPLGSSTSDECRIDSIAQSWAVLSGGAPDFSRAKRAMEAVEKHLVSPEDQLIRLFAPPFDTSPRDPGYIKGYPPGIRENGGQYTHAAIWAVWAFAELGQGDRSQALFRMVNPIYHGDTPEKIARYRVEPYVIAADVYSIPPHAGQGGWTWYTGSGSWMYRLGLEAILGFRRAGNVLHISPCIPGAWPGFTITYRHGASVYHIQVLNPKGVNRGVEQILFEGEVLSGKDIPLLAEKRRYDVVVRMG
ncbi:MAG: glucoamylase family protein [Desulfosalsimonadaceae bacterium]